MPESRSLALILAAANLLWSCGGSKAPSGQVVATVNRDEVTLSELNQEAKLQNIGDANNPAVRQQLLQTIIDRKLLAGSATNQKIDRGPDYLLLRKRAEELILSDLFIRKSLATNDQRREDQIEEFARSKPDIFARRTIFTVDQIIFPQTNNPTLMRQLGAAKSLDEIEQRLSEAGVPRERATAKWDSARMPEDLPQRLRSLGKGEPFVRVSNPMVAGVIVGMESAPVPDQQRRALAAQGLEQQRVQNALTAWLERSRKAAKIQYQPGYAPKAMPAAPKATAAPKS
jgi:EpsD family peptidyl-prolyl cis-trans isomerase